MNLLTTIKNTLIDIAQRKKNRDEYNFNQNPVLYYHGIMYACDCELKINVDEYKCTGNCEKCNFGIPIVGEEREAVEQRESRRHNRDGE